MSQHGIAAAAAAARPVSYATRAQARASVTSLTRTQSTAPVYLIASPAAGKSRRWARCRRAGAVYSGTAATAARRRRCGACMPSKTKKKKVVH